jgi:hypothetical protein
MTFLFSGHPSLIPPKISGASKRRSVKAAPEYALYFSETTLAADCEHASPNRQSTAHEAHTFRGAASYGKQKTVQYMFGRIAIPAGYDGKKRPTTRVPCGFCPGFERVALRF